MESKNSKVLAGVRAFEDEGVGYEAGAAEFSFANQSKPSQSILIILIPI